MEALVAREPAAGAAGGGARPRSRAPRPRRAAVRTRSRRASTPSARCSSIRPEAGCCVLFSSHQLDLVEDLCERGDDHRPRPPGGLGDGRRAGHQRRPATAWSASTGDRMPGWAERLPGVTVSEVVGGAVRLALTDCRRQRRRAPGRHGGRPGHGVLLRAPPALRGVPGGAGVKFLYVILVGGAPRGLRIAFGAGASAGGGRRRQRRRRRRARRHAHDCAGWAARASPSRTGSACVEDCARRRRARWPVGRSASASADASSGSAPSSCWSVVGAAVVIPHAQQERQRADTTDGRRGRDSVVGRREFVRGGLEESNNDRVTLRPRGTVATAKSRAPIRRIDSRHRRRDRILLDQPAHARRTRRLTRGSSSGGRVSRRADGLPEGRSDAGASGHGHQLQARPCRTLDRGLEEHAPTATSIIGIVLLFFMLTQYCTWILIGVMQEKSSRVVEVLLAMVRPIQLLGGKVLGIGLVALGQATLLVGFALVARGCSRLRPAARAPPRWCLLPSCCGWSSGTPSTAGCTPPPARRPNARTRSRRSPCRSASRSSSATSTRSPW